MLLDKSFKIALLISTVFHMAFFLPLPFFKARSFKKPALAFKITYLVPEQVPATKVDLKSEKPIPPVKQKEEKKTVALKAKVDTKPKPQKEPIKKELKVSKQQNDIPPEVPKEKEAEYLNYTNIVREKLRKKVEKNYNNMAAYRFIPYGQIRLHFILLPNGRLKEAKIIEEKSTQLRLLKEIVKKSIQEASPFLPLPKGLDQSPLPVEVSIFFEP